VAEWLCASGVETRADSHRHEAIVRFALEMRWFNNTFGPIRAANLVSGGEPSFSNSESNKPEWSVSRLVSKED